MTGFPFETTFWKIGVAGGLGGLGAAGWGWGLGLGAGAAGQGAGAGLKALDSLHGWLGWGWADWKLF